MESAKGVGSRWSIKRRWEEKKLRSDRVFGCVEDRAFRAVAVDQTVQTNSGGINIDFQNNFQSSFISSPLPPTHPSTFTPFPCAVHMPSLTLSLSPSSYPENQLPPSYSQRVTIVPITSQRLLEILAAKKTTDHP